MQYLVAAKCLGVKSVLNFYQKPHIRFFSENFYKFFLSENLRFFKIAGVFWADGTVRIINVTTNRMQRFFHGSIFFFHIWILRKWRAFEFSELLMKMPFKSNL